MEFGGHAPRSLNAISVEEIRFDWRPDRDVVRCGLRRPERYQSEQEPSRLSPGEKNPTCNPFHPGYDRFDRSEPNGHFQKGSRQDRPSVIRNGLSNAAFR